MRLVQLVCIDCSLVSHFWRRFPRQNPPKAYSLSRLTSQLLFCCVYLIRIRLGRVWFEHLTLFQVSEVFLEYFNLIFGIWQLRSFLVERLSCLVLHRASQSLLISSSEQHFNRCVWIVIALCYSIVSKHCFKVLCRSILRKHWVSLIGRIRIRIRQSVKNKNKTIW